jgi:hypothetical protein
MFQSIFSNSNSNSPSHNNNHNTNKSKSTQTTFPQELHKQRRHIEKIQSLIQESKSLVISPQTAVTILEQWITKQEELRNKLHDTYYSLRVMNLTGTQRLQVWKCSLLPSCIEIIQAKPTMYRDDVIEVAWAHLHLIMASKDDLDRDNIRAVAKGVEMGLIDLAIRELKYQPLRRHGQCMRLAFIVLTNTSSTVEFSGEVVKAGAISACLNLIRDMGNIENHLANEFSRNLIASALGVLSSLAGRRPDSLLNVQGVQECAEQFLPYLNINQQDETMVKIGIGCARLLIRLKFCNVVEKYPVILEFYPIFLERIIESGPKNGYLAFKGHWAPSGIGLDLTLIANSLLLVENSNNPYMESTTKMNLLIPLIPLIIQMMLKFGRDDLNLIKYGILFLAQISVNDKCLVVIRENWNANHHRNANHNSRSNNNNNGAMLQEMIYSNRNVDVELFALLKIVGERVSGS